LEALGKSDQCCKVVSNTPLYEYFEPGDKGNECQKFAKEVVDLG
jgi:hypothetical protein